MSNDMEDPGHSRLPFSPPYGWILSGLFLLLFSWAARSEDLDPTLRARWASDVGMAGRKGVSDGRVAFVLTGEAGNELAVLDVSNPAHPRPVGRRGIPGARDLALADQHLYVAAFTHGLRIIDVRNPSLPKIEAFLSTTGLVTHVAIHQGIACVLEMPRTNPPPDGSAGTLLIADITDPGQPRWIGDYLIPMEGRSEVSLADVAISEGLACIVSHGYNPSAARRESTLDVIDLSNPADPRRTAVHSAAGDALAVAMSGRHVLWAPEVSSFQPRPPVVIRETTTQRIDLTDPSNPKVLSSLTSPNDMVREIVIEGTRALLVAGYERQPTLAILDLSNAGVLRSLGRRPLYEGTAGGDCSLASLSSQACLITSHQGLQILDVSNSEAITTLSSLLPVPAPTGVAISGDHVVVTHADGPTQWIHLREPSTTAPTGQLDGAAWHVAVSGTIAYLAPTAGGVDIVDAADPRRPQRLRSILESSARNIADLLVAPPHLFVADRDSGLHVVNIADPRQPVELAVIPVRRPGSHLALAFANDRLFLISNSYLGPLSSGEVMDIFDIADPSNPRLLKSWGLRGEPIDIAVHETIAYVSEVGVSNLVEIIDVSDPVHPRSLTPYIPRGPVTSLSVENRRWYLVTSELDRSGTSGLPEIKVFDLAVPESPQPIGRYVTTARGLDEVRWAFDGDRVVLSEGLGGIQLVDFGVPAALVHRSRWAASGETLGVDLPPGTNHVAYVASGTAGVRVVGLESPDLPGLLSIVPIPGGDARRVAFGAAHAYVAAGNAGLAVLDTTNPRQPRRVAVLDTPDPGYAVDVLAAGSTVYLADSEDGVSVYDVELPQAPRKLATWNTLGSSQGLARSGNLLVVAIAEMGLEILDVSNRQSPTLVSRWPARGTVVAVAVADHRAYVADGVEGFTIVDLEDPSAPKILGTAPGRYLARQVAVSGRLACIADVHSGVRLFDCADPAHPRDLGGTTITAAWGLGLDGDRWLTAGRHTGLWVFDPFTLPLRLTLTSGAVDPAWNLRIDGPVGTRARLQQTSDLRTWSDRQSVTLGDTPQEVPIPRSTADPGAFFRLVSP